MPRHIPSLKRRVLYIWYIWFFIFGIFLVYIVYIKAEICSTAIGEILRDSVAMKGAGVLGERDVNETE